MTKLLDSALSVLVLIHGGSYDWNSGNSFDPSVLAAYGEIIVVTLNYRLGVFGFLSCGDPTCKGNWALSDIVCALDVLRSIISEFGGDPHSITLLGWDTGAAIVNLLMASPISAPVGSRLFQRAILLGGSALSSWSTVSNPGEYFYTLAEHLGCQLYEKNEYNQVKLYPVEDILECIRQESTDNITRAATKIKSPTYLSAFGPVIDGIIVNTDPSYNLENHGSLFRELDLLIGMTKHEAFYTLGTEYLQFGLDSSQKDSVYRTFVRNLFEFHRTEIFHAISNEYTDWSNPTVHQFTIRDSVLEALSDGLFAAPITRVVRLHSSEEAIKGASSQYGNTYLYYFSYETEDFERYGLKGSVHLEDLPYILGYPFFQNGPTIEFDAFGLRFADEERKLSQVLMHYISAFVKTGEFSKNTRIRALQESGGALQRFEKIEWFSFLCNRREVYLKIDSQPQTGGFYRASEMAFWNNFLPLLHESGKTESNPEHHLLPQHYLKSSYFGVVKQKNGHTKIPFIPPPLPPTPIPQELTTLLEQQKASELSAAKKESQTESDVSTATPSENYSTILSVTVAVGCALLILNILIFAGIFHQRDKQRRSKKLNVSGAVMDEQGGYDMGAVNAFNLVNPANIAPQRMPPAPAAPATMNPTLEPAISLQDGDIHPLLRSIHQQHQLHSGSVITEHEPLLNQKVLSPVCPRHSKHTASNALEEIQV